jgi:hypothetical protein
MDPDKRNDVPKFVLRLMPKATEAELREATATLKEYMVVAWDIFQRIKREHKDRDSPNSRLRDRVEDADQSV